MIIMKLIAVIISCLIGLSNTSILTGIVSPYEFGTDCTLTAGVTNTAIICVSKTQFVMSYQDPRTDTPLTCPAGTVCYDGAEVCSATEDPACYNELPGAKGACNECVDTVAAPVNYSPVCVSKTEYAFCSGSKLLTTMKYTCAAPNSYCKASRDNTGKLIGICTSSSTNLDCPS